MNSPIGRMQTDRGKGGSAQAELYPKVISQFVIPFMTKEFEQQIVRQIKRSEELRREIEKSVQEAKSLLTDYFPDIQNEKIIKVSITTDMDMWLKAARATPEELGL